MTPKRIAQASFDRPLSNSRAEVLSNAGFVVETFRKCEDLARACAAQRFDVLIVGHSLEYPSRNEMCSTFRKHNKGGRIVQLDVQGKAVKGEADYVYDVSAGPASLILLLTKILDEGVRRTSV